MALAELLGYIAGEPFYILAVLVLVGGFTYALSFFLSGSKPGSNPFSISYVRPPAALVTDRILRKKVLKQKFKAGEIQGEWDDIVIGSGIGSLTCAVLLGRAGHKVLVLEQHDQAGGGCHTFMDKGYEFDTGIHYVGRMMEGDMCRVLTDQITEGQVVWQPMDQAFDRVAIGTPSKAKWFSMLAGDRETFAGNLKKQFPKESEAIDKIMDLIQENYNSFVLGFMLPKILPKMICKVLVKTGIFQLINRKFMRFTRLTIKDVLDDLSDDEEFKAVMAYNFGDFGCIPSELGTLAYAQLMMYYSPGAYYPLGGTSEVAFQIIPIIERYGGRVLTKAPVSTILLDPSGKAIGVRVRTKTGDTDIFAKQIVSGAGIKNTYDYLLPREVTQSAAIPRLAERVGSSISYMSVFVGLEGTADELGLNASNTWAFTGADLDRLMRDYQSLTLEEAAEMECPGMFVSSPSAKDPAWPDKYPGRSVALLIGLVPYKWFKDWEDKKVGKRGDEYQALKDRIGYQMVKQFEELFPKTAGKIAYTDVGSPVTNRYYLGQPAGEIYGLDHNNTRFWPDVAMSLRAETDIPGLYLTGQDIVTCGFCGAMHAGVLTASAIMNRNLFYDLISLTRQVKKNMKKEKV